MKCKYCNNEINEENKYERCPYCGARLDKDEPKEQINEQIINEPAPVVAETDLYQYGVKRYWLNILFYYLMMLIGSSIIVMIVTAIVATTSKDPIIIDNKIIPSAANTIQTWTQILTYVVLIGVLVLLSIKDLKYDTSRLKPNIKKIILTAVIGVAVMYATSLLLNVLYTVLKLQGDSQNQMEIESMLKNATMIEKALYAIIIVIVAPLVEEIIFRKSLFGVFKKLKIKKIYIVLITGAIFGLMHITSAIVGYIVEGQYSLIGPEFLFGITYIAMGIIFGYVYYKSDENIYSSLILHIINNLISVILVFIAF